MRTKIFQWILIVVAIMAFAAGCGDKKKAPEAAAGAPTKEHYEKIREEMKSLYLVQSLLGWYVRTQGERSVFEESYKGHEDLFTKDNVNYVGELMKSADLTDDEQLAAKYLRNALLLEYVAIDTAHFDDEVNDAEASATVKLDWIDKPVPYREINPMMANENDPERRQKLQAAEAQVWKDTLNPILAKQEERVQQLAVELGFPSYVALSEEFRNVDLKKLIAAAVEFVNQTDDVYQELFKTEVQEVMGFPAEKFTRADIQYFASVPAFKDYFPPDLTIPSFMKFLEGMKLDLTTKAGTQIKIDDEPREKKHPRAACFSITVPDDIRITVKPSGGIPDFETFFHESGHAMHYANTSVPEWEFQELGNNAVTEGFAIFFENMWGDYEWLLKYNEIVAEYNKTQPAGKKVPIMTDEQMGKLIRNRVFWKLYMARRYNWAKSIYETILHGGSPDYYEGLYDGPTDDPHQVYKYLFSKAYGFQLTDMEALRYRTDVDSFFYNVDYARAFLLSEQLDGYMRKNFGARWFEDPAAGAALKDKLWALGNKPHCIEISKLVGFEEPDYRYFKQRIEEQLAIAERLIGNNK